MKACIFDIKEFALNDGPGIRTTFFFKGCPLRCQWCHNPEGLSKNPEINLKSKRVIGKLYELEEIENIIQKNIDLYNLSNGGVTFSGGEPLLYYEFIKKLTEKLRDKVNFALETSGYISGVNFEKILNDIDLFLFDLKIINKEKSKKITGADTDIILDNLRNLSIKKRKFIIRIPLIYGYTDSEENLKDIALVIKNLEYPPCEVNLLAYNPLGAAKYPLYGRKFVCKIANINETAIKNFIDLISKLNITVKRYKL